MLWSVADRLAPRLALAEDLPHGSAPVSKPPSCRPAEHQPCLTERYIGTTGYRGRGHAAPLVGVGHPSQRKPCTQLVVHPYARAAVPRGNGSNHSSHTVMLVSHIQQLLLRSTCSICVRLAAAPTEHMQHMRASGGRSYGAHAAHACIHRVHDIASFKLVVWDGQPSLRAVITVIHACVLQGQR